MQLVTSFESGPLEEADAQRVEQKFDYSQVDEALKHDRSVAENVFARCAKHHVKKRLGDNVKLSEPADPEVVPPIWVASMAITLRHDDRLMSQQLNELTESLITLVLRLREGREVLLVGPLNTKILEVGDGMLTFSLKQKWSLDGKR